MAAVRGDVFGDLHPTSHLTKLHITYIVRMVDGTGFVIDGSSRTLVIAAASKRVKICQ